MEDIYKFIDENKELYIQWLQEICRIPSVAAQNRGMKEAAEKIISHIQEANGEGKVIQTSGFPVVYGAMKGKSEKTLSFYNHYDVQPKRSCSAMELPAI